jgi:hypothetical protein
MNNIRLCIYKSRKKIRIRTNIMYPLPNHHGDFKPSHEKTRLYSYEQVFKEYMYETTPNRPIAYTYSCRQF